MFVNVYCLKKIVAKPLQTAAIPPQNRGAVCRFHLYCINKSKITANQMCHFLIDGAKVRAKKKPTSHFRGLALYWHFIGIALALPL